MMFLHNVFSSIFYYRREKRQQMTRRLGAVLEEKFTYYQELTPPAQEEFLERVYQFHKSKNFHYVGLERNLEVEVLISSAAIQLTFGLPEYCFHFFGDVYVMKDAYTYGLSGEALAGHVSRGGIYISWTHFQQGFAVSHDRSNTGLHEMAHALEYEFAYGDYEKDLSLKPRFEAVMTRIGEILVQEQQRRSGLYSDQGVQNKHECWAESVEVFFENPGDLLLQYSGLYDSIKSLLNQDPQGRSKKEIPGRMKES
jgi:Mlc titration factor MtfA (ptsG expression regulator)